MQGRAAALQPANVVVIWTGQPYPCTLAVQAGYIPPCWRAVHQRSIEADTAVWSYMSLQGGVKLRLASRRTECAGVVAVGVGERVEAHTWMLVSRRRAESGSWLLPAPSRKAGVWWGRPMTWPTCCARLEPCWSLLDDCQCGSVLCVSELSPACTLRLRHITDESVLPRAPCDSRNVPKHNSGDCPHVCFSEFLYVWWPIFKRLPSQRKATIHAWQV